MSIDVTDELRGLSACRQDRHPPTRCSERTISREDSFLSYLLLPHKRGAFREQDNLTQSEVPMSFIGTYLRTEIEHIKKYNLDRD